MILAARQWLRYVFFAAIAALAVGGLWLLLRPSPVDVEVAPVERGLLRVTLDEQAETRSHDRFVITAPVAGRVLRLELHEGDAVTAGQTIAELEPAPVGERELRELEARLASAELISTRSGPSQSAAILKIRAPVAGRVLRLPEKSDRVVSSGASLAVIGDVSDLEVLIEMLSTDAVKVTVGMPVFLDGWGGDRVLHARVAVIEPYAFTKVSALGVEEKRTNVIAEFTESPAPLGDGYRLQAHVVTYSADGAVRAPAGALFPCGEAWSVFALEEGRARIRRVLVGHRTPEYFEVQGGIAVGTEVVCYPPNDLADGSRVKASRRPNR